MKLLPLLALYGIIAGLIVAAPTVGFMVTTNPDENLDQGVLIGYLTMLVALTAVFVGVKHYRDKVLGGAIKFGTALLVGLDISAVASLIYTIGWEVALAWSGYDFASSYSKMMMDAARAKGASPEELQKVLADAESFVKSYANPLFRMPLTFIEMFPVGVLVSLISAGLLRNTRLLPARAQSA